MRLAKGATYGRWTIVGAVGRVPFGKEFVRATCACDGREHRVRVVHLLRGRSKSCGCGRVRDLTGLRVGRLVALEQADRAKVKVAGVGSIWWCRCDCGRRIVLRASDLTRPQPTRSCGCEYLRDETPAPPTSTSRPLPMPMRVTATRRGEYGGLLRREGDVFTITNPAHFSPSWMEAVDASVPEHRTTALEHLAAEHDGRAGLGRRMQVEEDDDMHPVGRALRGCRPNAFDEED